MKRSLTPASRRRFLKRGLAATAGLMTFPEIVPASVLGPRAPSNRIQVGQIGCGRIARAHDLPETMRDERARVVAVCDVDRKRAAEGRDFVESLYAEQTGEAAAGSVRIHERYQEMLADPDIDAVIISTPDHWHAQPAIEAALAGKHIYLQKPTSLTVEEGRRLSDIVHRTGVILQIGSQQRSMPQFHRACELVRNGRIGRVHTVRVGLPGDPSGPEAPEMPVPENLDYDGWLGSTDNVYYTEMRVHPNEGYDRPGWLRCRQFGAGMITGWGAHHLDTVNWALGYEHTGPVEVEGRADWPSSGLWDVHMDFSVWATFGDGTRMHVSGDYTNGVRFEGEEGWIWVARGDYSATPSDPTAKEESAKALDASDPAILTSEIGPDEYHLHQSLEQHADWLNGILARRDPVAPVEPGHRACSACLISHIAMQLERPLSWDPVKERFHNDDEANAMLSRPQRYPYGSDYILDGFRW